MALPVLDILPDVQAALAANQPLALIAPPGAGKTTAIPPALIDAPWAAGRRILLLQPRRLAARAAAERMAALAGEPVGQTIGYRTRLDSRTSAATRLEVVTEGLFVRQLIADPELAGVAAVMFDEVHERSLAADTALALLLDARAALRPDLRLVLMSATLDGAAAEALIPGLVTLESRGRSFPVSLRHIGRPAGRLEDAIASAILSALASAPGALLAFLPGVAEIERTATALEGRLPPGTVLHRLHGALGPEAQRAALAPTPQRKVVLATAIAETSLTIEGVGIVVDSGLARRPRFDATTGLTRLTTERASQAAVTQRAGRAGRTAPGLAIRLWDAAETIGLPPHDPPEILEADLAGLILDCALWGVTDPARLPWRDPPPAARLASARASLTAQGLLDSEGRITPHGRACAALPLPPALAHMVVRSRSRTAARLAVLLTERGLGGTSDDLDERLRRWSEDRSPRAEAARRLADRIHSLAGAAPSAPPQPAGPLLALAFPDRLARRRGAAHLMANGRAVQVPDTSPLARAEWLMVADAAGSAAGARLTAGAALAASDIGQLFTPSIAQHLAFDPASKAVIAETRHHIGAITLKRQPDPAPDPAAVEAALIAAIAANPALLPAGPRMASLAARHALARAADPALPPLPPLADWLPLLIAGQRRLDHLSDAMLADALESRLDWASRQRLDALAPSHFTTPAGSRHPIDYAAPGGPAVEVRVQALFGLTRHPQVAGRPLTLRLTSPAGRPIQVTCDLPGFWVGSWAEVRRALRGRYPRHPWPEDPASAPATLGTSRSRG